MEREAFKIKETKEKVQESEKNNPKYKKRRIKIYMNKVLKEENETRGMERKLSQSEPGEIDPEWPTIVKLMDCKEKK